MFSDVFRCFPMDFRQIRLTVKKHSDGRLTVKKHSNERLSRWHEDINTSVVKVIDSSHRGFPFGLIFIQTTINLNSRTRQL
jgi:hypothetical protein